MSGANVRGSGVLVGYGASGGAMVPTNKRAAFTLSDGTRAAISCDPNQVGITGDGGDNSGVIKFYVTTSPDGVTWTLRATITPTTAVLAQAATWAACIGTNNNLHLCWRGTTGGIYYKLITFGAGPTYTAGADETVLSVFPTNGNTSYVRRLDMDVAGSTNNAVIAAYCALTASATLSNRRCEMRLFTRSNTPTWVAAATTPFTSASQWYYLGSEDITIAADAAGPDGSNNINCVVVHTRKRNDGVDLGDMLWIWRTNVATGASVSITADTPTAIGLNGFNIGQGGGIRTYYVFPSANGEYTILGLVSITPTIQVFIWRFTVSAGGVRTDLIGQQRTNFPVNAFDRTGTLYGWGGVTYGADSAVIHGRSPNFIYGIPIQFFRTPAHTARVGAVQTWDEHYTFNGVRAQAIVGSGNNRNFSFNHHDVIWFAGFKGSTTWYRQEWFNNETPASPRNVTPAASSTITTDRPSLAADHAWPLVNMPQVRTKISWQLATDAGFTTNLRTVTEADADFVLALNTPAPISARVTATEVTTALSELFQGTWFVRARVATELGDVGSYSTAQSFVVTHPPAATNQYPKGDVIFDYGGSGNVTFSWKFTDPSPYDFQTAYQIIIEDAVSSTGIVDTGKIISTVESGTHSVTITGKDIQLRWKIRLWDSDDVPGNYSDYQTFFVVDKPAVVINYPTAATVNSLTADDSTFETTAGSWIGVSNAVTPVRDVTQFHAGVASLKGTATAAAAVILGTSGTLYPCYPGQELTEGGWSRAGTTGRTVQMLYRFFDISGTYMGAGFDILGTTATDINAGWTQIPTKTTFAPAGAVTYQICVQRNAMGAAETFFIDDIVSGDTGNINTANPTVSWTTTIGGGRTQTNYRVVISQGAVTIYDSLWQLSSTQAHVIPIGYLLNNSSYTVTVSVRDSLNLENSASAVFNTVWAVPAAPSFTLSATNYETLGYVQVAWTNAAIDADFIAWNVYRRRVGATSWNLIDQESINQSNYTFNDYLASSNILQEYTVTQVVDRFGSLVESTIAATQLTPVSTVYWLIYPVDAAFNMPLRSVTDDPHTYEYDQAAVNIIGRGRHVDYGDRFGVNGTITAKLRDIGGGLTARDQRENLIELRDQQSDVYVRNPFGDVWRVALGNVGISRIAGVGLAEYVDVNIPYLEVAP